MTQNEKRFLARVQGCLEHGLWCIARASKIGHNNAVEGMHNSIIEASRMLIEKTGIESPSLKEIDEMNGKEGE